LSWEFLGSEQEQDHRIFRLRNDLYRKGEESQSRSYVVIDGPDWVNVVALTTLGAMVLVRQFRHAARLETVEFPGGMVDPGESAMQAGQRELREETGYASTDWEELGWVHPNPAIQSNRCYTLLARNCELVSAQDLDSGEDIVVEVWPRSRWEAALDSHEFTHSLVVAGFLLFLRRYPEL
jgi:ADP-ribose pyrophosphatase